VRYALPEDKAFSGVITAEMAESAKARGTGIAKRSPEYIEKKIDEGKAVIAVTADGTWVGFCYIEAWGHGKFVANSGLIVSPAFRGTGVASEIKAKTFELSRLRFPESKIFGLTTGLAVMKINSRLGYKPVTYSELTDDEEFWKGCQSCVNFDILQSKQRKNCLCTAMLYDPADEKKPVEAPAAPVMNGHHVNGHKHREFANNFNLFERWVKFKQFVLLEPFRKKDKEGSGDRKGSFLGFLFW
jgi:hypothetical protein